MGRRRLLLLMALLISLWERAWSQNCGSQITCGRCIQEAGCAWCFEAGFGGVRCQAASNLTCSQDFTAAPQSRFIRDVPATSSVEGVESTINVADVVLDLRVGDPETFTISVTPRNNLPLDLYILIDLSGSMNTELQTVQAISGAIAGTISEITRNVRLGMGAFNEKLLNPFVEQSIDASDPVFNNLLGFRHIASLTEDVAQFERLVANLNLSSNTEPPENGLEALAQVITCEEIIGWRSRGISGVGTRLVLFMTDEEYHYAGEGRLLGILKPYNRTCQLEVRRPQFGYEYFGQEFDYPSVGEIAELLREFDVNTIFAIQADHLASYELFVSTVVNENVVRAATEGFDIDSVDVIAAQNQILDLIRMEYQNLLQAVSLDTSNINPDRLSLEIVAACPNGATAIGTSRCDGVPLNQMVNFTVKVTLNSCEGIQHGQMLSFPVTSPSFGSFNLNFTAICNCQCALEDRTPPPGECSDMGVQRCAVCECNEGKCGSLCTQQIGDRTSLDCPRDSNNVRCSDRGRCDCVCICNVPDNRDRMIFGDACECDNFRCPITGMNSAGQPEVCSGLERGMCCEGACICRNSSNNNPYRGEGGVNNCQCEPVEEACVDPETNTLCNNRGTCGCQFCECADPMYGGKFCDIMVSDMCGLPQDETCIQECRSAFDNEDEIPDICTEMCTTDRPLLFVDNEAVQERGNSRDIATFLEQRTNDLLGQSGEVGEFIYVRECTYSESDLCSVKYYVLANATHITIVAERFRECMDLGSVLGIEIYALALIIIGALIVLGILLLILIKVIFLILDYIEVKKWQKDAQTADFSKNTNPLYQSPEMKYENIAYGRE